MYNKSRYSPDFRQPSPSKPKRFISRGLLVAGLAMALLLAIHIDKPSLVHAGAPKTPPKPTLSQSQSTVLANSINQIISAHADMDIGVAVEDLNNNQQLTYGDQLPFIAASVSKVLSAVVFLHGTEVGQFKLNQNLNGSTAQNQLQAMIVKSDNDAWSAFNDLIGHPALLAYAGQIGLSNYNPEQNTLTVSDIATLFSKLYERKLLNENDTKLLLSYMKNANENSYIVASVPAGIAVYHKAGWLDDRVHDAAIIDNSKHPYVLVIFSKTTDGSNYPGDEGHQIYTDITSASLKAFN